MGIARNIAPVFDVSVDNITVGTGTLRATSAGVTYSAQKEEFPDKRGETVGEYFYGHKREFSIDFYPGGTSASAANSAIDFDASAGQKLKPGKALTLSGSHPATNGIKCVIDSVQLNLRTDGRATYTIGLHAHDTHGNNIADNEITV